MTYRVIRDDDGIELAAVDSIDAARDAVRLEQLVQRLHPDPDHDPIAITVLDPEGSTVLIAISGQGL